MKHPSKAIIRYLRECYRENGSRQGIWNLFSTSVSHRVFLNDTDFVHTRPDEEDAWYLRDSAASEAATRAAFHAAEKELVYASLFLLGWAERGEDRPVAICAPLFLYPAFLDTKGLKQGAALRINTSRQQLNTPVLEALGGEALVKQLESVMDSGLDSAVEVGEIRQIFASAFPDARTDALWEYPHLVDGSVLKSCHESITSNPGASLTLLPAACVALVDKSAAMRGVLNELEAMSKPDNVLSSPVSALLGDPTVTTRKKSPGRVPALLSSAQQRVLDSARKHPLTLMIGPPGTGKTFTIAALAIETMSRGGSVLIATKMDHAVDVVGSKIEESLGLQGVVIRGGRSGYLKQLKQYLDELLSGIHTSEAPESRELLQLRKNLQRLDQRIRSSKRILHSILQREQSRGRLLGVPNPGILRRARIRRLRNRMLRCKDLTVWERTSILQQQKDNRNLATVEYLKGSWARYLSDVLEQDRPMLQDFSRAIRARTGTRQSTWFEKVGLMPLLGAFPVWLVNTSDIHRVLPLEGESFDLAIIDESTQCDIASAFPILQRARRAVISGDPKQLRHLSFLAKSRQDFFGQQQGLDSEQIARWDFRNKSLLDAALECISDQRRIAFLNEHFRSRPEIIAFSNREFYGNQLRVMTGLRSIRNSAGSGLRFEQVLNGKRGTNGANRIEADALVQAILQVVDSEANLPASDVHSIGVLSPFRGQVDYLRSQLSRIPQASAIQARHRLIVGTAHTFQGEERDLMFISLTLDRQSASGSFRFLERADVFNVMVTRARLENRFWYSFDPAQMDPSSLMARYLAQRDFPSSESAPPEPVRDAFAAEVMEALIGLGAEVKPHFPFAGFEVDLLYTLNNTTRGIDLVGFPGATAEAFPWEQVLTFRRAGLPILPLPYSHWVFQRQRCLELLTGVRIESINC